MMSDYHPTIQITKKTIVESAAYSHWEVHETVLIVQSKNARLSF